MAGGQWFIAYKSSVSSGQFISTVSPPTLLWILDPPPGPNTGGMVITFESSIWLEDGGVYTEYLFTDLPPGFRILTLTQEPAGPNLEAIPQCTQLQDFQVSLLTWSTNIAGWDSGSPTLANLNDLIRQNILTLSLTAIPATAIIRIPGYTLDDYPNPETSYGSSASFLNGSWDDLGAIAPTPGGLTNVSVTATGNPNEYTVTLTPGGDTDVIEIDTPDDDPVVIPVGSFPAVVILTTGPVTITPINTNPTVTSGPPTVVTLIPQYDYTMSGGINLGGTPTLQFIGNPSGIYTIVPGKAYDTLYERIPSVTSQDVKIPDPTIVTAYIGE